MKLHDSRSTEEQVLEVFHGQASSLRLQRVLGTIQCGTKSGRSDELNTDGHPAFEHE